MTKGTPQQGTPRRLPKAGAEPKAAPRRRAAPYLGVALFSLLRWPSPETTEWFCLRAALWWVVMLLPALHIFATNASFAGLRRWGPEQAWQGVLGAALAAQLVAVLRGQVWLRVAALTAFGMIWAFVAALLYFASPALPSPLGFVHKNTGTGAYGALSADCYLVAIHLVYRWFVDHLSRRAVGAARPASASL